MTLDSTRSVALIDDLIRLVDSSLRRHGIPLPVREDIRQDVLLWFLTTQGKFADVSPALVEKVVRQFLRPNNLRRYCPPSAANPSEESRGSSDDGVAQAIRLEPLRGTEAKLVSLILEGATWHEACGRLEIPEGSRSYWRRRLQRRFTDNEQAAQPHP